MERMYYSTIVSFRQAGKEKKVKIYFRIPGFLEISFESKPKSPLEKDKFYVLAGILALAIPYCGIIFVGNIELKAEANVKFLLSGRGIEAGEGFCVFAGLNIKKSEWPLFAVVTAKEKPNNLISGYWKQKENTP